MRDRDAEKLLEQFLADVASTMAEVQPYSEATRQLAVETIRRMLPWEPHPEGGWYFPWPAHMGKGEVRWDGDLLILNTGTLHAALEHITVNVTVGD